jgi:saccharopine dehydrogenase-like NADP-dependent oxidoreductase
MGKRILVLGAGRSSSTLIRNLVKFSGAEGFSVRVGDLDEALAQSKINGVKGENGTETRASAFRLDADDAAARKAEIAAADIVVSMLPAFMHPAVMADAIEVGCHAITPSYVSPEMAELGDAAANKGVMLINELGLDPGIDHMSAMAAIDEIRDAGGQMTSFESYTGGLVARESDDNPWHYKFTWNPRNVVLAGQGGSATYLRNGGVELCPPHRLFQEVTPVEVPGEGRFEGYANRDSLGYADIYGLQGVDTLVRGTLRGPGFCAGWDALFQLGMNRADAQVSWPEGLSWRQFTAAFVPGCGPKSTAEEVAEGVERITGCDTETMKKLVWLGLFEEAPIGIERGSPADVLQKLLETKWRLSDTDIDLIVMWHRFKFIDKGGVARVLRSWLTLRGEDYLHTGMSKTVGLPLALAARHIARGDWNFSGLVMPTEARVYKPLLAALAQEGVGFSEDAGAEAVKGA